MAAKRSGDDALDPGDESAERADSDETLTQPLETFEPDELDGPAWDLDRRLDDANPQPGNA